jgi:hypothetical protein
MLLIFLANGRQREEPNIEKEELNRGFLFPDLTPITMIQ